MYFLKRFFITFALCFCALCVFSQERVNRTHIGYDYVNPKKLTTATKWYYSDYSGQWSSYKNFRSEKNFSSIQSKSITIDGVKYYVLSVATEGGYYEYPELRVNYTTCKMIALWIFTDADFKKLFNLDNSIAEIPYMYGFVMDGATLQEEENTIYNTVKNPIIQQYMGVYKATDGSVRFTFGWNSFYKDKIQKSMETEYFETSQDEWMKLYMD